MDYKTLRPEHNYGIIGSGKISRRVVVSRYRKRKRKRFKPPIMTSTYRNPEQKLLGSLTFPSSQVKIVFAYWQHIGYPFTKHRELKSKTTSRAIRLIQQELKTKSPKEICNVMDICKELFLAGWFKWNPQYVKTLNNKLSLPNFFSFPEDAIKKIRRTVPDCPKSWYKECTNLSREELKDKYSFPDKFPEVTEQLIDIWKQYNGSRRILKKDRAKLVLVAKKIKVLEKRNKGNQYITDRLQNRDWQRFLLSITRRMLNEYRTFEPKHIGWLLMDDFYDKVLPEEIIRQNLFTADKLRWKGLHD